MHAAGGWVVLLHLFSGNKVVLWSGSLDPTRGVAHDRAREGHGHQHGRGRGHATLARRLGRLRSKTRHRIVGGGQFGWRASVDGVARSVPRHLPFHPALRRVRIVRDRDPGRAHLLGADRGEAGAAVHRPAGGGDGRRDPPTRGTGFGHRRSRRSHRAYPARPTTRTRRNRPRRSSSGTGADGRSPGTWAPLRTDGTITLLGRGTCASTRGARRSIPRRSRPCCASPAPSTTWWSSACPTSAGGSVSSPSLQPAPGTEPTGRMS